jgi:hypothetical protein
MPWVLDGSNLAGGRQRGAVRDAALGLARRERISIVLFFDGAPPAGSVNVERLGAVEVRYVPNADIAIIDFLRGRGRGWRVATDDRALAMRVRAGGAEVVGADAFWAKARRGASAVVTPPPGADQRGGIEIFQDPANRLPKAPQRVVRRRGRGPRPKGLD